MKIPIEGLTPAYWDDVRKYSDKLLAGAESKHARFSFLHSTSWENSWWSESANRAILEKGIVSKAGFLALFGATNTYYNLKIKGDPSPKGGRETYSIQYNPDKEVIDKAGPAVELNLPVGATLIDILNASGEQKAETARLEADGHYKVDLEDYELLHTELRWGVSKIGE